MRSPFALAVAILVYSNLAATFSPVQASGSPDSTLANTIASEGESRESPLLAIARLEGRVEGLALQLETERDIAKKVLDSVELTITIWTAAVALIALILAALGYSNLRTYMVSTINRKVRSSVDEIVEERCVDAIRRQELKWDQKFDKLYKRIERLNYGGSAGESE
ncbi:MAG: hypothetical protein AB7V45_12490 [Candidatus Krumholzibacteriia bacterium]